MPVLRRMSRLPAGVRIAAIAASILCSSAMRPAALDHFLSPVATDETSNSASVHSSSATPSAASRAFESSDGTSRRCGVTVGRFAELVGVEPSFLLSDIGKVDGQASAATSLMQQDGDPSFTKVTDVVGDVNPDPWLNNATGSILGLDLCSQQFNDNLKYEWIGFMRARPQKGICAEVDELGDMEKTQELASRYFEFIGSKHSDPMKVIAQAKFYKLPSFDAAYREKIAGEPLPGLKANLSEVLKACFTNVTAVLRGGAVRDLFVGERPVDIDVDWGTDTLSLLQCMWSHKGFEKATYTYKPLKGYAQFGSKSRLYKFDPLEGFANKEDHTACSWENTVNALMYDPIKGVIIDPLGFGVKDVCRRKFRLPPTCNNPKLWMGFETKYYRKYAALRYAKMLKKGFSWGNPARDLLFLTRALNAQMKKEGKKGATSLVADFYNKWQSDDNEKMVLLAAHRQTLFKMMAVLCDQLTSLRSMADSEEILARGHEGKRNWWTG